jgi:hypothetical protein
MNKFFKYTILGSLIGMVAGGLTIPLDKIFNKYEWFLMYKDVCTYVMISLSAVLFLSAGSFFVSMLIDKINNKNK